MPAVCFGFCLMTKMFKVSEKHHQDAPAQLNVLCQYLIIIIIIKMADL